MNVIPAKIEFTFFLQVQRAVGLALASFVKLAPLFLPLSTLGILGLLSKKIDLRNGFV